MDTVKDFKKNKYIVARKVITEELCEFITQYSFFDELQNPDIGDPQVPNAHSKYADPSMETVLLMIQPAIERLSGLDLYPTYSYYRIYRNGDILSPHRDRESCEISATVCFGYRGNPWSIFMDGSEVLLEQGDIAIYRGCDVEHWRDKFICNNDEWLVQGFFHYVDKNGPFTNFKYDNRPSVGFPKNNNKFKKYITYI